jgi:hypothetical protein
MGDEPRAMHDCFERAAVLVGLPRIMHTLGWVRGFLREPAAIAENRGRPLALRRHLSVALPLSRSD